MQTRSRAREIPGMDDAPEPQLNGADQVPPHELSTQGNDDTIDARGLAGPDSRCIYPSGRPSHGSVCGATPHQSPPPSPRRSRELSSAPEEEEQRQEEVNSRVSRPEVAQTQEQYPPQSRPPTAPLPSRGVEDPYLALAIAPPRRSPFSTAILAEALPAGVKVSNLSEYDGTGDPQEHLDKFYAKIDWYDLSDAAYCKVFRTTLSKRALAWFNQLPAGTISSLEQLTQRFCTTFP
ncbi:UNVERIFIED_CONTAM: hypothetical protein Sradi_5570200 [Sesamum radiatum]|uniref:Retrotransposon gag domain-containing protein n=1 Tax=Sesamum radiatum TaxID=300843 RepID=A0AAW2LC54_SESRA